MSDEPKSEPMKFNEAVALLSKLDDNVKGRGLDAAQWARALRIVKSAAKTNPRFREFGIRYYKRTR